MNSSPSRSVRLLLPLLLAASPVSAQYWTTTPAPTQTWTSVACSVNGASVVAVSHAGSIYTSTTSGSKWTHAVSAPSEPWSSVANSSDGSRWVAVSDSGVITVSTNSGSSWPLATAPGSNRWAAVALSADGSRGMAASIDGGIYGTLDWGLTWDPTPAPTNQWAAIAGSADGSHWIAGSDPGPIYVSTDSGASWNTSNVPVMSWTAVASSSDGTRLVAAATYAGIYVSSNSGVTWTQTTAPTNEVWTSMASAADGQELIAAGLLSGIYTSTNAGLGWQLNQAPGNSQYAVCISADGSKPFAAANGGGIYVPGIPPQLKSNSVVSVPQGSYQGLFFETNGISPLSSGSFSATLNSKGTFSAKLTLAPKSYSFTGKLQLSTPGTNSAPASLAAAKTIMRPGQRALTVTMDFGAESNAIIGQVSNGEWNSMLEANRAFYSSTNSPALGSSDFTFLIPSTTNDPAIAGFGYGAVHVSPAGKITVQGSLADGSKFTQTSTLSQQNQFPCYRPLYGGNGLAIGWLSLAMTTNVVDGELDWIRPPLFGDNLYPAGFKKQLRVTGSPFHLTYSAPIVNLNTGSVSFVQGSLAASFTNQFAMRTNSITRNLSDNSLSLQFQTLSGLFKGTVVEPVSGQRIRFSGAMLQSQNRGRGFFLGTDQPGGVFVDPSR